MFSRSTRIAFLSAAICAALTFTGPASAKPITLLPFKAEFAKHRAQYEQAKASHSIVPPPVTLPAERADAPANG